MSETNRGAGNKGASIHQEIRQYFLPVSKNYLYRVSFFVLYCAFLVIPATVKFLGQFRTGGAFIAIFMGIFLAMPWVQYFKSLKAIEERWPTAEMQEELYRSFAESQNVFGGEARIGRNYTFLRKEIAIVPTKDVKDILMFRNRTGMLIKAALSDGDVEIAQLAFNKEVMEDVKRQVTEAKDCLAAAKE